MLGPERSAGLQLVVEHPNRLGTRQADIGEYLIGLDTIDPRPPGMESPQPWSSSVPIRMSPPPIDDDHPGEKLALVLRALRRRRGLRPRDVAEALQMPQRSYEHFESASGRLNPQRIHEFAEITNSDGFAILASLTLNSPEFALRCADNKLMTILMMALQDFDAKVGDDIGRLDARTLIGAFTRVFDELAVEARRGDGFVAAWREQRPLRGPSGD